MADCTECLYAQGDECIQYAGDSYPDCDLVQDAWYKIDDLITRLQCAASQGTTTSTTTSSTTTTMYSVSFSDQGSFGVVILLQPGEIIDTPGPGSALALQSITFDMYLLGIDIAGKYVIYKSGFNDTGTIIYHEPAQYVQSLSIPAARTILITSTPP